VNATEVRVADRLAEVNIERKRELVNRRGFLRAVTAAAILGQTNRLVAKAAPSRTVGHNLVPDRPSGAPNYWCTWAAQNYMYGHNLTSLDPKALEGESGSKLAHQAMSEEVLFGEGGWVNSLFPNIRKDLYLLLDDGWQVGGTATFELDTARFPNFAGSSADRLKKLNRAIQERGWRGAGLWCRNTPGGAADYRLERLSASAEIHYWKIDLGDPNFNLIRLRNASRLPLLLEHVHGEMPINGDWRANGRFGAQGPSSRRIEILKHTDVYRTYDVTSILSLPTTLDRAAAMLKGAEGDSGIRGLLNVEDEVYVAAVLGCTMGIMRHPMIGLRPGDDVDLFFNGPRMTKKRMDEVVRAIRWQRIAPPFSPGIGEVAISSETLTDTWRFERGQTWQTEIIGNTVRQGAPAAVARGLALPEVKSQGEKPFVLASRFPNGAVAIAAQERTEIEKAWFMPPCAVSLSVSDAPGPFGIFGQFDSLTLVFDKSLQGRRILAQDLAGDEAFDVSHAVLAKKNILQIPGTLIREIGLNSATQGDLSSPGVVLSIAS